MKRIRIELICDSSDRLNPDTEKLGRALQDLYFAAHHAAGVDFDTARQNWKEEHLDIGSTP